VDGLIVLAGGFILFTLVMGGLLWVSQQMPED
jgi:hypothetical protein